MKNKIILLALLFTLPQLLIAQFPELTPYRLHLEKVKKGFPKNKVYRLAICLKDSIFPDSLLEYTNLMELNAERCWSIREYKNGRLNSIPEDICKLKNLIRLKLSGHRIKRLPDCLSTLNLKYLELDFNAGISIDNLSFNDSLKFISLDNCKLDYVPKSIGEFSGLRWLALSDNNIKYIPKSLAKLKNLNSLHLSKNPLQEYDVIFSLENLKSLDLSECGLDSIPSAISNLKKLKYLNISNNNIGEKEIRKLKKLLPNCEILF